jgi:hypothetical protein
MAIADNIKNAVKALFGIKSTTTDNSIGLQRPVTKPMEEYDRFATQNDRQTKIRECREMAEKDVRVKLVLNKESADAMVNLFTVNITSANNESAKQQAQDIIDKTITNCQIYTKSKGWIKATLRDGDFMGEIVVDDATKEIARLKKLEPLITWSNMNPEGNYPEGESAYYQTDPWRITEKIKTFEEWQILHLKWQEEDGKPYGDPMFSSARVAWKWLNSGEKNIVARRSVVSGDETQFQIGNPDRPNQQEILDFQKTNEDTIANPLKPVRQWFTTGNVNIKKLSSDSTLGDIVDIEYFENQLYQIAGVPKALAGKDKDINRDVLQEQEEDYYRVIQSINDLWETGLRKLFDFALLLQDIDPDSVKYTFNWGAKDREDIDSKIARAEKLQSLGMPFEIVFKMCDLDGYTYEEVVEKIKIQIADGIIPYGIGTKLDPNMVALLMGISGQGKKNEGLTEEIQKIRELAEMQIEPEGRIPLVLGRKNV